MQLENRNEMGRADVSEQKASLYNGGSTQMAEGNDIARMAVETDSGSVILLTPEGYEKLQKELEHLTMVKRPEIAGRIRESQEHGEFSEDNNELDEVKFEQAIVEKRIAELKALFGTAQIIEPEQIPEDHVGIGSVVKLRDMEFGDEFEVRIVMGVEADPSKDLLSNESPMGVALVGKVAGEVVTVEAPDGKRTFTIAAISR